MPPKSTRGRRPATRASARKSGPKKCKASPETAEESPATTNDVAVEVEAEKAVVESPATVNPENKKSLPETSATEQSAGEGEGVLKDANLDVPAEKEAGLGSTSETLVKEGGDGGIEGSEKENQAVVAVDDGGKSSTGGKQKKVVKKTVKVIKKVIKKVPKKRGEHSVKVDDSSEIVNIGSAISSGVEAEDIKPETSGVEANAENCTSDVPVAVKMEEEVQIDEKKDRVEGEGEEGKAEGSLMEVENNVEERDAQCENENENENGYENENENGYENENENKNEKKENENENENENEKKNQGFAVEKGEADVMEEEGEGEEESGCVVKEEMEEYTSNAAKEEMEEDTSNVTKEETGEGKFFRGELEAMERRKRRRTEIFIGGLDKDAKEEDIRKVFSQAGEIVDLRVVMNGKTGKNKGFAFLRYASAEDAKRALEKFAKVEICGKQCGATPVEGNDTLFLGNIDKKWKDEDVVKLLQGSGIEKIDKVTVMIDPNKSEFNRGFAFVEFETSKDAQSAFKRLQNKDVFGKNLNIKVAWAEPLKELDEEEIMKVKTIYAEFIPSSWDEEKVKDTFKKFGEIEDVVLARNLRTTKRKDFAFISYKTREYAIKCIESFSRELKEEDGTKVNMKVSLAKPMQKNKKQKPTSKPVAKDFPKKKQKISHSNLQPGKFRNMPPPALPHYDIQMTDRSSTNVELVQLLREQASWRPSHPGLSNGPMDVPYSSSLPIGKRRYSMLEADPLHPEMNRYPYPPRLDASFPVASSSRNMMPLPPTGPTNSLPYQPPQHSAYPSGSLYGAEYYPGNTEMRGRAPGNSFPYHRY